jgi:hypothetical protein
LQAPIALRFSGKVLELPCGELLIGRSPGCDIWVDEPLISRVHALLTIEPGQVSIEDLRSRNGVQVNGRLVLRTAILREGDCVSLSSARLVFTQGQEHASSLDRPAFDAGPIDCFEPGSATMRSHANDKFLELLGRLADELASSGQARAAVSVLSQHLRRVLARAGAGFHPSDEGRERACQLALGLARSGSQSGWLDYVLELHMLAGRRLSGKLMAEYAASCLLSREHNRDMLSYYVEWARATHQSAEDLAALERLMAVVSSVGRPSSKPSRPGY